MATRDRAAPRPGWTTGARKEPEHGWWITWPKSRHRNVVPADGKAVGGQVQADGVCVTASLTGAAGLRDGDGDGVMSVQPAARDKEGVGGSLGAILAGVWVWGAGAEGRERFLYWGAFSHRFRGHLRLEELGCCPPCGLRALHGHSWAGPPRPRQLQGLGVAGLRPE